MKKAKYIYDALILRTEYEQGSADSQTICSVLLNQRSVCQGYAKTFQYLCQLGRDTCDARYRRCERGRTCLEYRFPRRGLVLHRSDLGRRFLSEKKKEETPALTETVNYDYFCVTTQEIERTHSMDDNQLLPVCNAVQDQYYRHEGLYLQSADKEKIDEIFCTRSAKGRADGLFSVCGRYRLSGSVPAVN